MTTFVLLLEGLGMIAMLGAVALFGWGAWSLARDGYKP